MTSQPQEKLLNSSVLTVISDKLSSGASWNTTGFILMIDFCVLLLSGLHHYADGMLLSGVY